MQEEMLKQALYQELLLDHNQHMLQINIGDNQGKMPTYATSAEA